MHRIEHVVVLMVENRSFDSMLGRLYPKSQRFDGLDLTESNPWHCPGGTVQEISAWSSAEVGPKVTSLPEHDPGELFSDITMQLFGLGGAVGARPSMNGFVDNYMRQDQGEGPRNLASIMHHFSAGPRAGHLATGDRVRRERSLACLWTLRDVAKSLLCPLRNGRRSRQQRAIALSSPLAAIAAHDLPPAGALRPYLAIYFHDLPQAATLVDLWTRIPTRFCFFEAEFERHARSGRLANYSFIERMCRRRRLVPAPGDKADAAQRNARLPLMAHLDMGSRSPQSRRAQRSFPNGCHRFPSPCLRGEHAEATLAHGAKLAHSRHG